MSPKKARAGPLGNMISGKAAGSRIKRKPSTTCNTATRPSQYGFDGIPRDKQTETRCPLNQVRPPGPPVIFGRSAQKVLRVCIGRARKTMGTNGERLQRVRVIQVLLRLQRFRARPSAFHFWK